MYTHTVINIFLALIAHPSPAIKGLFSRVYPYVHQHSICSCCAHLSCVLMLHGGPIKIPPFDQAVGLCFAGISANSPWLQSEWNPIRCLLSGEHPGNTANACCYYYHKYPMKLGHTLKKEDILEWRNCLLHVRKEKEAVAPTFVFSRTLEVVNVPYILRNSQVPLSCRICVPLWD